MKNIISHFSLLFSVVVISSAAQAAINPKDLTKVTGDTNIKCVEYYQYKGEMYCSTKALSNKEIDPKIRSYEKQILVFDDRPWQAAWGKQTEDSTTVEYIPAGDDIDNWHELITSQFFEGIPENVSPKDFADTVIKQMQDAGYSPNVTFIEESPTQVIFEFKISEPQSQAQDEIQKITKGKDGFYVLHYVIKKSDMGQEQRDTWLKRIKESSSVAN